MLSTSERNQCQLWTFNYDLSSCFEGHQWKGSLALLSFQ